MPRVDLALLLGYVGPGLGESPAFGLNSLPLAGERLVLAFDSLDVDSELFGPAGELGPLTLESEPLAREQQELVLGLVALGVQPAEQPLGLLDLGPVGVDTPLAVVELGAPQLEQSFAVAQVPLAFDQ